jgi:hypothetical protein
MSSTIPPAEPLTPHDSAESRTPIGVDLGEKTLVAALPAGRGLDEALVVDGEGIQGQYHALAEVLTTVRDAGFATDGGEAQLVAGFWSKMRQQVLDAAARTVSYARQYTDPVLAIEALGYGPTPLWEHELAGDCGTWLLPVVQEAIITQAADAGVDVVTVDPEYSSQACHRCGAHGDLGRATLLCTADECPVERVDRDISAAKTLATRAQDGSDWTVHPVAHLDGAADRLEMGR